MLDTHSQDAVNAGVWLAYYHWLDPIYSGKEQADYMLKAVNRYPYKAIAVDIEQWWSDWGAWEDWRYCTNPLEKAALYELIPTLTPAKINSCAAAFVHRVKEVRPDIQVIIYTRASYIIEYCKLLMSWISAYPIWYAYYPFSGEAITTSWQDFLERWIPQTEPKFPRGYPIDLQNWYLWQFTGDKFTLPGCTSKLDINYWKRPDVPHIAPKTQWWEKWRKWWLR
jgi:GH25 family lysozyme M1 (1,4-beta-N-acetylmuramidase)